MPLLKITTNQVVDPDDLTSFTKLASTTVAKMLGKPETYVMVSLEMNPHMLFAGSPATLAYLELKSIGMPTQKTTEFSQILCDLIQQQLHIPKQRIYIEFSNAERHLWGWNAGTF
ncbi:MAG: phenylpyruvate tautomerase MIF-related protein [Candidatus Thiodiazotropha sp. (ex. Lucinoma kazani)]